MRWSIAIAISLIASTIEARTIEPPRGHFGPGDVIAALDFMRTECKLKPDVANEDDIRALVYQRGIEAYRWTAFEGMKKAANQGGLDRVCAGLNKAYGPRP